MFTPKIFSRGLTFVTILMVTGMTVAPGQSTLTVFGKLNLNSSGMRDLKLLQEEVASTLTRQGIPAAITEAYPARVGFQAGFLVPVNSTATRDILIGGFLDYSSTGGRVHYADYSGEVRNDHILSAYSIGTTLSGRIRNLKPLTLDFGLGARLVISKFKNEFSSTIGTSTNNLVLDFSSTGVGFEPGIAPSVSIFGANLGATVSYMFYIPTRLNSDQFKDAYLTFNRGGEVTIDWSGPRLGVIVGYDL